MSAIRLPNLSKLHSKPVVRCECDLIQFQTGETCRRCKLPFEQTEAIATLAPVQTKVRSNVIPFSKMGAPTRDGKQFSGLDLTKADTSNLAKGVAAAIWLIRVSQGVTQTDIAKQMGVPRSYMTKVERGAVACLPRTIERFAGALGVTPYGLLLIAEAIQ